MDKLLYVPNNGVPYWAQGVSRVQVVTPAPLDMDAFFDPPLLHSLLSVYQCGVLPVDVVVHHF